MSKKQIATILILALVCAVILIYPLMTIRDSEFGGADVQAEELIAKMNPDYTPWAQSVIELPGGETETLLFCLQTALGTIVIGFGFGYLVARKKYRAEEAA